MDFKSKAAYKKWLAYGHASGEFAKTPGHQSVSIKGKKKKVKHENGSDLVSQMGYRDDSPFKGANSLLINTPNKTVSMDGVSMGLYVNGAYLPPNSGTHYVGTTQTLETPAIMRNGASVPNIPTWNYPSTGTPIYRNIAEIPPNVFSNGGPKDGIYTYNGVKYKHQNGKWYKNIKGTYKPLTAGNVAQRTAVLNKHAKPLTNKSENVSQSYIEDLIIKEFKKKGIDNPHIIRAAMGIMQSEGGLKGKLEGMYYTKERLPEVWSAFSTTGERVPKGEGSKYYNELAEEVEKNPEKLANYIYGPNSKIGRQLGNTEDTDGWEYRGRGFNQLTGRGNYKAVGERIGIDLINNPELLETDPEVQAKVFADYMAKKLNVLLPKQNAEDLQNLKDYNNIDNLNDAVYLLTRANAGFGKMPKEEDFKKREQQAKSYQFATESFEDPVSKSSGKGNTAFVPNMQNPEKQNQEDLSFNFNSQIPQMIPAPNMIEAPQMINPPTTMPAVPSMSQPNYANELVYNNSERIDTDQIEDFVSGTTLRYGGNMYDKGSAMSVADMDPATFAKYLKELKLQEGTKNVRRGRHYSYPSPEGGLNTIGYGHKLTAPGQFASGLSEQEAEALLRKDVLKAQAGVKATVDKKYGEGTFDKLPQDSQMLLTDYQFNLGSAGTKFPKFLEATVKGDRKGMMREYKRYFKDNGVSKELKKRNEWTRNVLEGANNSKPLVTEKEKQSPSQELLNNLKTASGTSRGAGMSTGKFIVTNPFKSGGVMFNDGGQMGMPVTEFGEGGSHEENPLGGIPQGIGANGRPNLVEEGELKIKDPTTGEDFIITNNDKMVMTKEMVEKYGLPKKYTGKKLNKIGRDILRLDSRRIGDSIEESSKQRELVNFIEAHRELTEMQNAKDAEKREADFLKEITELQEEYPEYMQALMSQGQPEMQGPSPEEQAMMGQAMMAEQQGMGMEAPQGMGMPMAYGGNMYANGDMIRRADGSYSQRGLWDNIRANRGSGKKPTKEMLKQERKINANNKAYGGSFNNPGFNALPAEVQNKIKANSMGYGSNMYGYGSNMYDFGGVARGIGTGLKALSGVASAIPGIGTAVGAAAGALGAGLENVGTGAKFGEVMADAGLGALGGAVPGVGGMVAGMAQGLVPNSPVPNQGQNGSNMYQNGDGRAMSTTEPPLFTTKEYQGKPFAKHSPVTQNFLAYKAGYQILQDPNTGEFIYQGVENPGVNYRGMSWADEQKALKEKYGNTRGKQLGHNKGYKMSSFIDPETGENWRVPAQILSKEFGAPQPAIEKPEFKNGANMYQNAGGMSTINSEEPEYRTKMYKQGAKDVSYYDLTIPQQKFLDYKYGYKGYEDPKTGERTYIGAENPGVNYYGMSFADQQKALDKRGNTRGKVMVHDKKQKMTTFKGPEGDIYQLPAYILQGGYEAYLPEDNSELKNGANIYTNGITSGLSFIANNPEVNELLGDVKKGQAKDLTYNEGIGSLMSLAPVAYNLYQGMQKPEQISENRYYNPVEAPLVDYSEANKQARRSMAGAQRGMRGAGSPGSYMANLGNLTTQMAENYARNIQGQENQQNLMNYQADAANAASKTKSTLFADQANREAEAARQAQLATGFGQLGAVGQGMEEKRAGLAYANMMSPDYNLDYNSLGKQFLNLFS